MICFAMRNFGNIFLGSIRLSPRTPASTCGGRLHWANYPRNPRGGPENLPKECCYRLSLCCDRDGCRKRVTPPSTRFLGRKVYLLSVIFLAAAMRQQPSPRSMRELFDLFGAGRRTIARGKFFGVNSFRRHGSGRPNVLGSRGQSTPPRFHGHLRTRSSSARSFMRTGSGCWLFSSRSRSREPWRASSPDDPRIPAEDAPRSSQRPDA